MLGNIRCSQSCNDMNLYGYGSIAHGQGNRFSGGSQFQTNLSTAKNYLGSRWLKGGIYDLHISKWAAIAERVEQVASDRKVAASNPSSPGAELSCMSKYP